MDTTDVVPMAKAELLRAPVLGGFLRRMGVVPVRRGESDLGAVRAALTALKRGQKLVIFPEGTRVTDGAELAGKTGAAMPTADLRQFSQNGVFSSIQLYKTFILYNCILIFLPLSGCRNRSGIAWP